MHAVVKGLQRGATLLLLGLIRSYQLVISPLIGPRCRFLPTCSEYAQEALEQHGIFRGSWLTLRRLLRCHPIGLLGGDSGYDPVPDESRKYKVESKK